MPESRITNLWYNSSEPRGCANTPVALTKYERNIFAMAEPTIPNILTLCNIKGVKAGRGTTGLTHDLRGGVFGALRVLCDKPFHKWNGGKNRIYWNCYCDPQLGGCGIYTQIIRDALISGDNKSCGCLVGKNVSETNKRKAREKYGHPGLRAHYVVYSLRPQWTGEISYEMFAKLVTQPCHYCGIEGNLYITGSKRNEFFGVGLDRIDSKGPYSLDNVVPCCVGCNMRKRNVFSYDEFKKRMQREKELIAEKRGVVAISLSRV